jgi:signal transduction histidine kinase
MQLATAVARFLPTDPGYTPFGLSCLRGLNAVHFALVALVGLLFSVEAFMFDIWEGRPLSDAVSLLAAQTANFTLLFAPMLVFVVCADNLSLQFAAPRRVALLAAATLLGALLYAALWTPLGCVLEGLAWRPECDVRRFTWGKVATFARGVVLGTPFTALLYYYKRDADAAHRLHEAHLRRLNAERQETEARLRSLQAQIEPHFLFNTLAHIQRLGQVRPHDGRAMLCDLIDYLRSALPQMRERESTIGRELALVRAYLNVQQIRMGERLSVEIDVPCELLDVFLPPMMLLTLAENAIKHGLGPKREGGRLHIAARAAGDRVEVEVRDDGVGLAIGAGRGRGLSNTRARLATMFGASGTLEIGSSAGGGVCALLALPRMRGQR